MTDQRARDLAAVNMAAPNVAAPEPAIELADLDARCFPASERWGPALWAGELEATDRVVLTRRDDDGLAAVATFQVVAETADLHRVMVRPDLRGRRLADELVRDGLAAVAARGAQRVLLEVRQDNTAALALYRRLGFEQIATRSDYYGAGVHALVLELQVLELQVLELQVLELQV